MNISQQAVGRNFSRAAARYDAHATLQRGWRARVLAHAEAWLPPQARVADIGCGTGAFAVEAYRRRPGWRIVGIDRAEGMCRQAQGCHPVAQGDACALPLADGMCEGVVSSLCLQWVADKPAALREIARILRPGGHAVLMGLGRETLRELHRVNHAQGAPLRLLPMEPASHYAIGAEAAGLEVLTLEKSVEIHRYASLTALLRSFVAIGANAAFHGQPQPLSPARYSALATAYAAQASHPQGGVAASWQPILLVLRKPMETA